MIQHVFFKSLIKPLFKFLYKYLYKPLFDWLLYQLARLVNNMIRPILYKLLYEILGGWISRQIGRSASIEGPRWLVGRIIGFYFLYIQNVNLYEAEETNIYAYKSVNAFFTRRLKNGARRIDPAPTSLVSPCDGKILSAGTCQGKDSYRVKGQDYALDALIPQECRSPKVKDSLMEATYTLIYLSPRDCHRLYSPMEGWLVSAEYLEGGLYPVKESFLGGTLDVFGRNRRLILTFERSEGWMIMIWVGAFNVGRFLTSFDKTFFNKNGSPHPSASTSTEEPIKFSRPRHRRQYESLTIGKGDELGAFELGSSVLLFLAPELGVLTPPSPAPPPSQPIRIGEVIGTFL